MILLLLPPLARRIESDIADLVFIPKLLFILVIDLLTDYFDPAEDDEFDDFD